MRIQRLLPLVVAGLFVVGIVLLVLGLTQPSGTGRLQVDRDLIDFGDQHFNTTVRATFNIKNVGDGPLTLNVPRVPEVKQGC